MSSSLLLAAQIFPCKFYFLYSLREKNVHCCNLGRLEQVRICKVNPYSSFNQILNKVAKTTQRENHDRHYFFFASDGVSHVTGLSFHKFFLVAKRTEIKVIKFNGNSLAVTVVKSAREVTVTMGDM